MERFLLITVALAFFGLLFSRLHFHFSFNLTISRSPKMTRKGNMSRDREAGREVSSVTPAVRSIRDSSVTAALKAASDRAESDIRSALLNLGCEKGKASDVARKAMGQGKDFTTRLQWAIQNAA